MTAIVSRRVTPAGRVRALLEAPVVLVVLAWNLRIGRNARTVIRELRELIAAESPDVICLQEAGAHRRRLRVAFPGWRVFAPGGASDGSVTMVRRSLFVRRSSRLRMLVSWVGPKAFRKHPGRVWGWYDIGVGVRRARVVNVHRTPGGPTGGVLTKGRNKPSWSAEHAALLLLADKPGSLVRDLIAVGDWNDPPADRHPQSPRSFATSIGARVVTTGSKVDYAIVRGPEGATGTALRDKHGSDHRPCIYHFDLRTRR